MTSVFFKWHKNKRFYGFKSTEGLTLKPAEKLCPKVSILDFIMWQIDISVSLFLGLKCTLALILKVILDHLYLMSSLGAGILPVSCPCVPSTACYRFF